MILRQRPFSAPRQNKEAGKPNAAPLLTLAPSNAAARRSGCHQILALCSNAQPCLECIHLQSRRYVVLPVPTLLPWLPQSIADPAASRKTPPSHPSRPRYHPSRHHSTPPRRRGRSTAPAPWRGRLSSPSARLPCGVRSASSSGAGWKPYVSILQDKAKTNLRVVPDRKAR